MPSPLTLKILVSIVGLAFVAAASAPAEAAKARKHKRVPAVHVKARPIYWGTDLVPAGPIYHGQDYLGDDPDPNIRFQIKRDLGAHYGDNE
jgi:hypothetical protein